MTPLNEEGLRAAIKRYKEDSGFVSLNGIEGAIRAYKEHDDLHAALEAERVGIKLIGDEAKRIIASQREEIDDLKQCNKAMIKAHGLLLEEIDAKDTEIAYFKDELCKAKRSLILGGYEDNGSELWKPPVWNKSAMEAEIAELKHDVAEQLKIIASQETEIADWQQTAKTAQDEWEDLHQVTLKREAEIAELRRLLGEAQSLANEARGYLCEYLPRIHNANMALLKLTQIGAKEFAAKLTAKLKDV